MDEIETSPFTVLREAWNSSPLDLVIPAAVGVAGAQFLIAAFALRSSHELLLLVCVLATAAAVVQMVALLAQLWQERAEAIESSLSNNELIALCTPTLFAVLLYALIAPNARMALFFAGIALPHLALVAYLAKTYGHVTLPSIPSIPSVYLPLRRVVSAVPAYASTLFEAIGKPVLQLAEIVRKAPAFKRP